MAPSELPLIQTCSTHCSQRAAQAGIPQDHAFPQAGCLGQSLQPCPKEQGLDEHAERPHGPHPTGLRYRPLLCSAQVVQQSLSSGCALMCCFPVALMTAMLCTVNAKESIDKAERLFPQMPEQKPFPPTPTKGMSIGQTDASSSKHRSEFKYLKPRSTRHLVFSHSCFLHALSVCPSTSLTMNLSQCALRHQISALCLLQPWPLQS